MIHVNPGKYSQICSTSPEDRLSELVEKYNSQEFKMYRKSWVMMMQNIRREIDEILWRYPELGPVGLKVYSPGAY